MAFLTGPKTKRQLALGKLGFSPASEVLLRVRMDGVEKADNTVTSFRRRGVHPEPERHRTEVSV